MDAYEGGKGTVSQNPSDEELLSHHLRYELEMLVETRKLLASPQDTVVGNALIESFCVHARVLIEFFRKPNGASKYADSGYKSFSKATKTSLKEWQQKLNNQVAHLLDCRTADDSQKLGTPEREQIFVALMNEFQEFKTHLKPGLQGFVAYGPNAATLSVLGSQRSATNQITSTTSVPLSKN